MMLNKSLKSFEYQNRILKCNQIKRLLVVLGFQVLQCSTEINTTIRRQTLILRLLMSPLIHLLMYYDYLFKQQIVTTFFGKK